MNKIWSLFLISILFSTGCDTHQPYPEREEYKKQLQSMLESINISDGISENEAMIISDNYYYRYEKVGCGAPGPLKGSGNAWFRVVLRGFAAVKTDSIRVDKRTGKVSWRHGPTIYDPSKIWTY